VVPGLGIFVKIFFGEKKKKKQPLSIIKKGFTDDGGRCNGVASSSVKGGYLLNG